MRSSTLFKEEIVLFIKTIASEGVAHYVAKSDGRSIAKISIKDGKLPGYSLIPVIVNLNGNKEGLLFLLNWITSKVKSPLLSDLKYPILIDYGFQHQETQLIWDPNSEEEVAQVVALG